MAGVVDDADGLGVLMIAGDDLLNAVAGARMIPDIAAKQLLQRAWRDIVEQRNRLNAFALQAAELPTYVMPQMLAWFGASETVGKLVQEFGQGGTERKQLIGIHP